MSLARPIVTLWSLLVMSGCLQALAATSFGAEPSLQEAIDVAGPGAILQLPAGVYVGSLVIERSLTLRGVGDSTILEGNRIGATVTIRGSGTAVRLEALTVRGGRGWNGHGIQVEGETRVELAGVTVRDNAWAGVWATERSVLRLTECRILENGTHGLYAWDFARIELSASEISRNRTHGVLAFHVSEISLVDSHVDANLSGIWAWDGTRVHAERTTITGNVLNGLAGQNGALLDLSACTVSDNGQLGLWLADSSRAVATETAFCRNGADGIFLERDGIAEFLGCVIEANVGFGIRAATASCMDGFDPHAPYKGWIRGAGNVVPDPAEPNGNQEGGLCPTYPGSIWPPGFLASGSPS